MRKIIFVLAVPMVAVIAMNVLLAPQKADAQSGTRVGKQAHYDALWSWLQRTNYTKWNGADGGSPDFEEGQSPHVALIKTYVSAKAETNLRDLPNGTVIVKENYSPDKKLMAITVMHRSTGYDPEHGDWYYAKYMPNGKIDVTPPEMKSMPVAGKFMMCIECHKGAGGNDFAFFND
ncbi:MAG: cytochrome P460 family protein [Planctomycetia bacterium]|nr:cytochrome P460 family protein [Planctomycetia bacterium]